MDEDADGETDAEASEQGGAMKNGWPGMNAKASLKQRARKTRVPGEKDSEDGPDSPDSPIAPSVESLGPASLPPQSPPVPEDPLLTMAKRALGQNGVYVRGSNGVNGANGTNGTNGTNSTNGVNNPAPALYAPPVGRPATEMQQLRAMLGQR